MNPVFQEFKNNTLSPPPVSQSSCRTTTAYLDLHRCVLCVPIKTKAFHLIETHASCVPGQLLLPLPVVVLLHSSVAKKIKYLCPSVSVLSTSSSSYRHGHKVTHRLQFVTVRIFSSEWNNIKTSIYILHTYLGAQFYSCSFAGLLTILYGYYMVSVPGILTPLLFHRIFSGFKIYTIALHYFIIIYIYMINDDNT